MDATPEAPSSPPPRLLDQLRTKIRALHYSLRTEQAYLYWVRRFIRFHGRRHPRELGGKEVEVFLSHLAVAGAGLGEHPEPGAGRDPVPLSGGAG
jgi:hypothetical protein